MTSHHDVSHSARIKGVSLKSVQDELEEVIDYARSYLLIGTESYWKIWFKLHTCTELAKSALSVCANIQFAILDQLCLTKPFNAEGCEDEAQAQLPHNHIEQPSSDHCWRSSSQLLQLVSSCGLVVERMLYHLLSKSELEKGVPSTS